MRLKKSFSVFEDVEDGFIFSQGRCHGGQHAHLVGFEVLCGSDRARVKSVGVEFVQSSLAFAREDRPRHNVQSR